MRELRLRLLIGRPLENVEVVGVRVRDDLLVQLVFQVLNIFKEIIGKVTLKNQKKNRRGISGQTFCFTA